MSNRIAAARRRPAAQRHRRRRVPPELNIFLRADRHRAGL